MSKDCKKEARDFDNAVHEMAYTIGQVWPILTDCLYILMPTYSADSL